MIPSQTMADQVADEIKIQEWVSKLRWAVLSALIVAVGGGAYFLINRAAAKKTEKAFAALYQAERIEEAAMRPALEASENSSTDLFYEIAKKWPESQQKEYLAKLDGVIRDYSNTVPAVLAGLRKGNFYFYAGQLPEAQKTFEEALKGFKPSSNSETLVYRAMVLDALAVTQESQKMWDEAYKTHAQANTMKGNPLKPLALIGMARVLQVQGKADQAKPLFEQLIKDFPNTEYEKRARALMAMPAQG